MSDKDTLRILLKIEMKLAVDEFKRVYKKVTKGVDKIYSKANLSSDLKEIQKLHAKLFKHISQSVTWKEKFEDV
jgi:hypothetical protein